ncbi:MAG: RagB/SusD family nutrient uptake outer membrane protein, partial [Muribaculaceae bacterium]|nr:RagB/SusD family nutrient uptake outer membrane protein [Muribaculaceae bacterium]
NNNAAVQGFDGGMSTFQRSCFILEEVPSDEANWIMIDDTDYGDFQYGITPANNRAVFGTYSRFMINIAVCNDFIQTVKNGYFNLTDELKPKADEFVRQAKILRSACYFYLISNFGNPPYADENCDIGSVPSQVGRTQCYQNVVTTLEDVLAEYGDGIQTPAYGYVGKDVCEALLVKFYLNAEVFTGEANWGKCLEHANAIIERHKGTGFNGTGLAEKYWTLFGHSNADYAVNGRGANEILWYIPQDDINLMSYANGDLMINGFGGNSTENDPWQMNMRERYNSGGGWKCMVGRQELVNVFEWDDAKQGTSPDDRVALWATSAQGFVATNDILENSQYGYNGYLPIKYSNWNYELDGSMSNSQPEALEHPRVGYAMIRLAEIYLSAAEAMMNGAGAKSDALDYVNYIRERAGLTPWSSTELTMESLQQERQRELYTECTRRTDLVRYGKWVSGYNWSWKNKTRNGSDFAPSFALYPIPSQFVTLGGYTQNWGY